MTRLERTLIRIVRTLARGLVWLQPRDVRRMFGAGFADVAEDRWRREYSASESAWRATVATMRVLAVDAVPSTPVVSAPAAPPSVGASIGDRARRLLRTALIHPRRSPLIAIVATASLAIGIGANIAVFTVANALLYAPTRGLAESDRLVDIGRTTRGTGFDTVSYSTYADLRDRTTTLAGMFALRGEPRAVSIGAADGVDRAFAQQVSASFFEILGVRPALGTLFQSNDERLGVPLRRVVLSYGFWRRRFGGDPAVVGADVTINGDRFAVAAVAPEGFQGTSILSPDLWVPLTAYAQGTPDESLLRSRESSWVIMGGRLKPGVQVRQAQAEMDSLQQQLNRAFPDIYKDKGLVVAPISRVPGDAGEFVRPFAAMLLTLTGLVLVVTCANLAGLLLAQAATRSREVAVRMALGAARSTLVGQFLIEAAALFVPGAIGALGVGRGLTSLLAAAITQVPVPIAVDLSLDWRVFALGCGLTSIAALATGLVPAMQGSRVSVGLELKSDESAPRRQRLRGLFVAGQIACCLLLLTAAGLLVRGLTSAARLDPGFRVDGIDVATIDLQLAGAGTDAQVAVLTTRLSTQLALIPEVESVSLAVVVPLEDNGLGLGPLRRLGDPASEKLIQADWNVISPGFLPMLRLPIAAGRNFTTDDRADAPLVAIVNARLARDLWPGTSAIGHVLETGDFKPGAASSVDRLTIVGVAQDAKYRSLGERPRQFIYVPIAQHPFHNLRAFLERRAGVAGATSVPALREALRDVDRNLPLVDVRPFRQYADLGLLPARIAASTAGALGLVALVLCAMGVYGVTAFAVAHRTREIGVRIALGATRARVAGHVVRHAARLAVVGAAIGLLMAAAAAHALSSLLFGVSPLDPLAFGGTALAMIGCALLAAWIPARRAARIDPASALRGQ